jgi:gamma-glutamylcyclotransferase (GGCT)/AIG2-like uncharacterized protein YtfP
MITVFVYGTLRRGEANDIVSAATRHGIAAPELLGRATVKGILYDFGSYPGLIPDSSGVDVLGDVYRIDPALVPVLDEIEEVYPGQQGLFLHQQIRVEPVGDELPRPCDCLFYPITLAAAAQHLVIEGGDWVVHRKNRDASPVHVPLD